MKNIHSTPGRESFWHLSTEILHDTRKIGFTHLDYTGVFVYNNRVKKPELQGASASLKGEPIMNNYVIFTDSACDIVPSLLAEWGVRCVSLAFRFNHIDQDYLNDDMPIKEFYKNMPASVPSAMMERVYEAVKTPVKYGPVVKFEADWTDSPSVFRKDGAFYMYFISISKDTRVSGYETHMAKSLDLKNSDGHKVSLLHA